MARKPRREKPLLPPPSRTNREKIIDALMTLLAERGIEEIGFGAIAARAGVPLAECRAEFSSVLAVLAAHLKEIDRKVLAGGDADMAEESPRERLLDVLMRRLEVLAPYKEAVRSLMRSACRHPSLALALDGLAVRSQRWMLTAAEIDASGPRGMIRAQGLVLLFARVIRVWLDDDPNLDRTLAALDRALSRGERWARFLDDLCRFAPGRCCPPRWRSRRRREAADEEPLAA